MNNIGPEQILEKEKSIYFQLPLSFYKNPPQIVQWEYAISI